MVGSSTSLSAFSYSAAASTNRVSRNQRCPLRFAVATVELVAADGNATSDRDGDERSQRSALRLMGRATIHSVGGGHQPLPPSGVLRTVDAVCERCERDTA